MQVAEVSTVDGTVTPVSGLDGAPRSERPWFLVHDGQVVVVDDRQVAVMDPAGTWSRFPQVPGARQAGRVAAVLGDELLVWGGRAGRAVAVGEPRLLRGVDLPAGLSSLRPRCVPCGRVPGPSTGPG